MKEGSGRRDGGWWNKEAKANPNPNFGDGDGDEGDDCELRVLVLRDERLERVLSLLDRVPRVLVPFKASRVSPPLPPH